MSMLVRPPTAQFIPTTDASGKGYGGVFMGEGETIKTVYYFYGEWSAEVQTLFNNDRLDINILELVTIQFLLHLAGSTITHQSLTIKCDNSSSVDLLTNYRARTWASGVVLEGIDLLLAKYDIDAKFEWIATELNRLSDWLSRFRLKEFMARVRQEHGNSVRTVELKVPAHLLEISHVVRAVSWSQASSKGPRRRTSQQ